LVKPEKNASAIEQKKMLPEETSVNGSVMLASPHVPVSALGFVDKVAMMTISPTTATARRYTLLWALDPVEEI
jgi:hypothetical protein